MSGIGRPPAAALGRTRTCPHCKATVLESASVCPGCRHHLRFDPGSAQREEQAFTAWKVDGVIGPRGSLEACEYSVVIALRNEEGRELARHVVAVGALQPHERRAFTLAVEVIPPRMVSAAPSVEAASAPARPPANAPNPSAPNRAPPAPPPRPGATLVPPGRSPAAGHPGARPPAVRPPARPSVEASSGGAPRLASRASPEGPTAGSSRAASFAEPRIPLGPAPRRAAPGDVGPLSPSAAARPPARAPAGRPDAPPALAAPRAAESAALSPRVAGTAPPVPPGVAAPPAPESNAPGGAGPAIPPLPPSN